MSESYRFGSVMKDPAESLPVTLDLFAICANYWRSNEQFAQNEFCRPRKPTGFSYEATNSGGGTSGHREPNWPTTIGSTVVDGSITWTCRAAGSSGLNAIISPSAQSDPSGLTIGSVSAAESTKILATYSGGTLGQDYEVVYTFTLNGVTRIARQLVSIGKR